MQSFGDWIFVAATSVFIFVSMRIMLGRAGNELALLRAVFYHSPASIAMTDLQGRFAMINREFERRYGVKSQGVLGKTVEQLFPAHGSGDVADRRRRVLETGEESKQNVSVSFANGTDHEVEITRFPIFDAGGETLGIGSFSVDVTERTHAERELRESESRMRAILDHAPVPFSTKGRDGRFQVVNKKLLALIGKSSDEVLGRTSDEVFARESADTFVRLDKKVMEQGSVCESEDDIHYPDGLTRSMLTVKFPIFDESGDISAIGGFGVDLTEQKRASLALSKSEGLLRAIIDNCPLVIALKDLDGRFQLINRYAKESSHQYSEAVYGKTGFDFRPRKEAEYSAARDREVIETGKPITYEVWNHLGDGSDHHFLVTKFPVFDESGEMTGVCLASLETTDMKEAEEALKESEALFRTVIDNSPLSIGLKDLQGRYRLINRRFRESLGAEDENYRGKTVADYRSAKVAKEVLAHEREVMEKSCPTTREVTRIGRGGEPCQYLTNRFPVFDAQGTISGIGFTSLDITERVDAERRLREMQSEFAHVSRLSTLGELAAGFAHELNQPLAAIRNYAAGSIRRIDAEHGDVNDIRTVIEHIAQQAARAGEIIMRIRKFIRKEEGEKSDICIEDVVRDSIGLLHGEALKHDAEITLDMPDDLPLVVADAVQIQQVIINLARNGMEAMDKLDGIARCVTVRAAEVANGVAVDIEDMGSGISDEVRERLFEPFFTTKGDGMGIGLLICQTIIEEHGGTLNVAQAPTGGAVVSFTLPVASQAS
ncbi:MAG: PAS domain-containing protein [Rhodospirillales bacterium]|nr:PAS domain-containing protein [Rhodospirillales bacterium]